MNISLKECHHGGLFLIRTCAQPGRTDSWKKWLVVGLASLGMAMHSYGQGLLVLDNYNVTTAHPVMVTYGVAGIPKDGVSGTVGNPGGGLYSPHGGWTAGFYWSAGDQVANVEADPSFIGIPTGGGLTLATGAGSSTIISADSVGELPGYFSANSTFITPAVPSGGTVTLELIAYSGTDYASANYRGHSVPFTVTVSGSSDLPNPVGFYMPSGFSVYVVPEPSVMALGGMVLGVFVFQRSKARGR